MTTNVTTVYAGLLTAMAALFTTKKRIPNPYSLVDNDDLFLNNGYGLKVGAGEPQESELHNFVNGYNFSVIFTKQVYKLDQKQVKYDDDAKAILEDGVTLIKDFLNADQAGMIDNVWQIQWIGNSAIEFFRTDKNNFINLEVNFLISISEDI